MEKKKIILIPSYPAVFINYFELRFDVNAVAEKWGSV